MLKVALATTLNTRVKGAWLASEQSLIVGVAADAVHGFDPLYWRITGRAVVLEECVS